MYNIHSTLGFGKHKNRTIWVVVVCNPTYIDWCINNVDGFCIEDLESLEVLPLFNSPLVNNPDAVKQMRERVPSNPELYQIKLNQSQYIEDYLTERGYDFYVENFKSLFTQCYKFKNDVVELNSKKLFQERMQELKYNSYDSSETYTFDDTINDAFEGDYSNYSNID